MRKMAPKRKITGGEKPVVKRLKKNDNIPTLPTASEEADKGKKRKTANTGQKAEAAKDTAASTKKTPSKPISENSPMPTPDREENNNRREVRWALPTQDKENNNRDQGQAITRYSESLYNQTWDEIHASQSPFQFPALRGPVYKGKGGKCKDIGEKATQDAHHSSATLQRVFNRIKHTTEGRGDNNVYTRDAFDVAFHETNDAVVASESANNPILVLDQDYRVYV
jgi:hypothetical protein